MSILILVTLDFMPERACVFLKWSKNGFNSGLPVSPVFEEDKIPKEIKNRHEAQSRPQIMECEQKPF
jgi:hypothetical protein